VNFKKLPVGAYGAVMGIAGLGLALRAAAPLFPGVVQAPAYVSEPIVLLGVLALLLLLVCYAIKMVQVPEGVKEDFTNPVTLGFCAAMPVGMTLVAGGLAPYFVSFARILWWIGCLGLATLQAWAAWRWLDGKVPLDKLNGGWLILVVGGIVVPGGGFAVGEAEAARFFFGASACGALVLVPLLLARAALAAPLPEALRPTWLILLVPPSLIYAHGLAFFPQAVFLESLYFGALVLAGGLAVYARRFWRWPFSPVWWAFTFPLDALAYAATRYAHEHPSAPWRAVAAATLAVATAVVALVLARTFAYLFSKRL
jgi:tellurite resistance protein